MLDCAVLFVGLSSSETYSVYIASHAARELAVATHWQGNCAFSNGVPHSPRNPNNVRGIGSFNVLIPVNPWLGVEAFYGTATYTLVYSVSVEQ